MAWNDTALKRDYHISSRYQSDSTDEEWEIIEPFIPPEKPGGQNEASILGKLFAPLLILVQLTVNGR